MRRPLGPLLALLVALVAVELAVVEHAHAPTAANALAGVVGCVLIVLASKALGKHALQEPEPPPDPGDD
jgi:lipopolysaccharide export LptBFGC system permease protein LptF